MWIVSCSVSPHKKLHVYAFFFECTEVLLHRICHRSRSRSLFSDFPLNVSALCEMWATVCSSSVQTPAESPIKPSFTIFQRYNELLSLFTCNEHVRFFSSCFCLMRSLGYVLHAAGVALSVSLIHIMHQLL